MRFSRRSTRRATAVVAALCLLGATAQATADPQPWRDTRQPASWRADALLRAMTLDEEVILITAVDPADFAPLAHLGIPAMTRVDASAGLRGDTGVTAFPVPDALAATFDPALARRYGTAIGAEARAKGWNVLLGPTLDIARDPRGGRAAESYGEDPLLSGVTGAAVAAGFEDNDVIGMLKHFTAYNQEDHRRTLDVRVSERALHEVYYAPFERAIRDGGADSVMCSYPKINGGYACQNPDALGDLKTDLGLRGYVATDFQPDVDPVAAYDAGVDSGSLMPGSPREPFHDGRIPRSRTDDAARRILVALFDSGAYDHPLPTEAADVVTTPGHQALATRTGEQAAVLLKNTDHVLPLSRDASIAVIGPAGDDAVTGVEGSSYVVPGDVPTPVEAITAKAGADDVVVSQGSLGDATLPTIPVEALSTPDGEPGLHADFYGDDAFSGTPVTSATTPTVDFLPGTPVPGLPERWSARWTGTITPTTTGYVRFAALLSGSAKVTVDGRTVFDGYRRIWDFFAGPGQYDIGGVTRLTAGRPVPITVEYSTREAGFRGSAMRLGWQPDSLIPAAVAAARQADTAVVFADDVTGEEVAAANPDTVVVLDTAGPVLMPWLDKVKGVVQGWYRGAAVGTSIANVLYGDADPGGRLPITFPATENQGPAHFAGTDTAPYDEGVHVGYRWYAKNGATPLFPFGYGLSYTTFAHDRPRVSARGEVTVGVRNTGRRTGSDVVQVYVGQLPTGVDTPVRALAGFARVTLAPGERRTVTVHVDRHALSYWDEERDRWVRPHGAVPVYVGRSAADVRFAGEITVR